VLHVVEILDLRVRILREMTESHVLLAAPGLAPPARDAWSTSRLPASGTTSPTWTPLTSGGMAGRQRRGSGRPHRERSRRRL